MTKLSSVNLISGNVSQNKVGEDIAVGDVVCIVDSIIYKADARYKSRAAPAGIAVMDASVGGVCVYAVRDAVIVTSEEFATQDSRLYVHTSGEVSFFASITDGSFLSVVGVPDSSPSKMRLVLEAPVSVKNPCWPDDVEVPDAPVVTSEQVEDSIVLSWDASTSSCAVQEYRVYEFNGAAYVLAYTTTSTTQEIDSLSYGTTYSYKVSAVNYNGESSLSNQVDVALLPPEDPIDG